MEDEESSSALVRKLTLQADYYAAVSPGLARFYMYEVESVKANLGRREARVSQLCQYCCTIWRPAHDHVTSSVTVTTRRRKLVSKAMKRLCRKETQQMNATEKKIFDKWMQSSKSQRLMCSVCGKGTHITYQRNDAKVKKKNRCSDDKQISQLISTSNSLRSKSSVSKVKPTAMVNASLEKKKIIKKKNKSIESDSLNISSINATPCSSKGGVTSCSSKGGVTSWSSKGGATPSSSKGGVTSCISKGGATPGSSKGGTTPGSSKGGATPGSSKGGGKSEKKKKKFSMLQTVLTREEKSRQTNNSSSNSLNLFLSSL